MSATLAKGDQLPGTVKTPQDPYSCFSRSIFRCSSVYLRNLSVRPPSRVPPGSHRPPWPFGRESGTHGAGTEAPTCDSACRPWLPLLSGRWFTRNLQRISFPWKFAPIPAIRYQPPTRGWLSSRGASLRPRAHHRINNCEPRSPRLRDSYWRVIVLYADGFSVTAMSAAARLASSSHSFGFQSNRS